MELATKEKIERRLQHIDKRIEALKEEHGETPSLTHTYHGGWSLGYWEGKKSGILDFLDELEEEQRTVV